MRRNPFIRLLIVGFLSFMHVQAGASSLDPIGFTETQPSVPVINLDEFKRGVIDVSDELGIDPIDLATFISYETGGTLDPWQAGAADLYGTPRRGFIQMGTDERRQYGYDQNLSVYDNLMAVGRYLRDRGVKPGMTGVDIYTSINAGRFGLSNRTDENNGGAPGTVRDEVQSEEMQQHRQKALELLREIWDPALATSGQEGAYPAPPGSQTKQMPPADQTDWADVAGYKPSHNVYPTMRSQQNDTRDFTPSWAQVGSSLLRDTWATTREVNWYFSSEMRKPDSAWMRSSDPTKYGTALDGLDDANMEWVVENAVSLSHAVELRAKLDEDFAQAKVKDASSLAFWGGQMVRICDPLLLTVLVVSILGWRLQLKAEDRETSKEA